MPFNELETHTRENRPPEAALSYMRSKGRGKAGGQSSAKPSLVVTIPTTICGIGKAKKHILLIGTGADAGKLRVAGVDEKTAKKNGAVAPTEFKTHFIWRFGFVPKLGDEIFDKQRCLVRKVSDDVFEIDVKKEWFEGGE